MKDQKILSLKVSNVKRIRVAHIQADGKHVVLTGPNDAGKTSAMDSVQFAINGGKSIPDKPLREGAAKGTVDVELNDFTIRRTFSAKGNTVLTVKSKSDGGQISRPQSTLDQLTNALTFDPNSFNRMSEAEQAETVRKLSGINFAQIDSEIQALESMRLDIGRKGRELESQLKGMKLYENVPFKETANEELIRELSHENDKNKTRREQFQRTESIRKRVNDAKLEITGLKDHIEQLQKQIKENEQSILEKEKVLKVSESDLTNAEADYQALPVGKPEEVTARIATLDEANRKVRHNQQVRDIQKQFEDKCAEYSQTDSDLKAKRETKAQLLANSQLPIDGLEFTEAGVTVRGIPFKQLGTATRIKLSAQIGIAMNPKLRVMFVRDASLMDQDTLGELMNVANTNDIQVWLEQVDERAPEGADVVVFEDGSVVFNSEGNEEPEEDAMTVQPGTTPPPMEPEPQQPMSMAELQANAHAKRSEKPAPPSDPFFSDEPKATTPNTEEF